MRNSNLEIAHLREEGKGRREIRGGEIGQGRRREEILGIRETGLEVKLEIGQGIILEMILGISLGTDPATGLEIDPEKSPVEEKDGDLEKMAILKIFNANETLKQTNQSGPNWRRTI